jgi:rhodanese-related sulfurtransferase
MAEALEIGVKEAQRRLQEGNGAVLIDVREPEEFAVARIEGSELVPMQSVPGRIQELEAMADERDLLVMCHHGVRSLNVVAWLRERGIENSFSVAGGIDEWSREIDPEIPRY